MSLSILKRSPYRGDGTDCSRIRAVLCQSPDLYAIEEYYDELEQPAHLTLENVRANDDCECVVLLLERSFSQPSEEDDHTSTHVLVDEGKDHVEANDGRERDGAISSLFVRVCGNARRYCDCRGKER